MPTIVPNASKLIDEAFEEFTGFQFKMCTHLRELIHKAIPEIKEDWKWGPNFNHKGMVCGVWGFKNHVTLVFYNGSLMKDKYKLFDHGKTNEKNRSIHFYENDKIDDKKVMEYLVESAIINEKGLKAAKKEIKTEVPPILIKALNKNSGIKKYFDSLAPSHKRDYIEFITEAKQEETRKRRIEKVIDKLSEKRTLNDKYMKK